MGEMHKDMIRGLGTCSAVNVGTMLLGTEAAFASP